MQKAFVNQLVQNARTLLSECIPEKSNGRRDRLPAWADQPEFGRPGLEVGHEADDSSRHQVIRHVEAGFHCQAFSRDTPAPYKIPIIRGTISFHLDLELRFTARERPDIVNDVVKLVKEPVV